MSAYRHSLLAFAVAQAAEQELQRQAVTGEDKVTEAMTDAALAVVLAECGETMDSIGDFALMTMRDVQRRAIAAALMHWPSATPGDSARGQ